MSDEVFSLLVRYQENVRTGLNLRWDSIPLELYEAEVYEVVGGLLSRQASLTIGLTASPSAWTVHIAPVILRSMIDAHITLAWILGDLEERARRFIIYGLGQKKLQIEHLRTLDDPDGNIKELISMEEAWLESQRREFLTEVNVGNWAGLDTRKMAEDAGCRDLYRLAYAPFSGATHNMWQHVSSFNLQPCANPLHKNHRIPGLMDLAPDLDWVYRSAKYTAKSYLAVDEYFSLEIDLENPFDFLRSGLAELDETEPPEEAI